jgi:hypothetical protein
VWRRIPTAGRVPASAPTPIEAGGPIAEVPV